MAGSATALKSINPNAIVIGVEPEGANDYSQTRKTGKQVTLKHAHSVADGLLAPTVGAYCKPLLDAYVDDVIVVTDAAILEAMKHLNSVLENPVEPSGATAYAAYTQYEKEHDIPQKTIVCMASGGNFDTNKF